MAKTQLRDDSGARRLALEIVMEHDDNLEAIVRCLEDRLADLCNGGTDVPDGAPYTEWRLARVLLDELESTRHLKGVASVLGIEYESLRH